MKSQWMAAGAALALAGVLASSSASSAKPGDLPAENGIQCPDGADDPVQRKFSIELGITPKGFTLKLSAAQAAPEAPILIDPLMPAYVEQMLYHLGDALARPERYFRLDRLLSQLPDLRGSAAEGNAATPQPKPAVVAARAPIVTPVEARLFEPVQVRIRNVPMQQALKNLAHASALRIVPDYRALRDAGVDLDAPVSLPIENSSVHVALQQLLQAAKLTIQIDGDVVKVTVPQKGRLRSDAQIRAEANAIQAQRLFETGERLRRDGEFEQARTCYQQAHLLTPTTLHGRMAIVRLEELEERLREVFEEQGGPGRNADPEQVYRDMHRRSIPLGLVEISH